MLDEEKIVDFQYCKTCKYRDLEEKEDPCHDCLDEPVNLHTKKPVKYVEDKKKVKELDKEDK